MNANMQDEQEPSTTPAASDVAEDSPTPPSSVKRYLSKLHWRAYCLAPNLIPHPSGKADFDTAHDLQENEESRIDLARELRSPMIWGVELYGPAEVGSLYAGLKKLGWSRAGGWKRGHDAASQVRGLRSKNAGAWVNLGIVSPRGRTLPPFLDKNFADLPNGVDSLIVSASQITPSLTAIVIGFQLTEGVAQRYEAEINKERRTFSQRIPRSWSIERAGPFHQKQRAVEVIRSERRRMVGAWFTRNLPGYFCGLNLGERFPTMELLVARGISLRDEDKPGVHTFGSWQRLLMNASPYEIWDSSECPGLQIGFEWHRDEDPGRHVYITLDPETFPNDPQHGYGEPSLQTYSFRCDRKFSSLLAQLAALEYLKVHTHDLHAARERLKIARSSSRDVAKTLGEIGRFFDNTLGAPAIVRELSEQSEHEWWFQRSCGDFGTNAWQDEGERRMLYTALQSGLRNRSKRLTEDETSLRTHFEQLSTILSVQENIRLQRLTLLLTFMALAAAFGSLAVAVYGSPALGAGLKQAVSEAAEAIDPMR